MNQPLSMNTFTRMFIAINSVIFSLFGFIALLGLLFFGNDYSQVLELTYDNFTDGFSSIKFESFIAILIFTIILSLIIALLSRFWLFLFYRKPLAIIEGDGIRFCETPFNPEGFLHWSNIDSCKRMSHGFIKGGIRLTVKNYKDIWSSTPLADVILTKIIWILSLGLWKGETSIHTAIFGNFKEFSNDEIQHLLQEVTSMPVSNRTHDILWSNKKKYKNRQTILGSFLLCVFALIIGFGSNHLSHFWDNEVNLTRQIRHFAHQGNPDAQTKLGWRYSNGVGVMYSHKEAVYWYKKAAEQGYAKSQYNLGNAYYSGIGIKRDYDKAFQLFTLAAEQNQPNSFNGLAKMYHTGRGVEKSYKKAHELYNKAISLGLTYPNASLGYMHEKGEGVQASKEIAIEYYKKAAADNNKYATKALKRLGAS